MIKKIKISKSVKVMSCLLIMAVLLAFSDRVKKKESMDGSIQVFLMNNEDNHYLDESEVISTLNQIFEDEGMDVNLKKVESYLLENPYIHNAQVYKDLKNNLMVNIKLRRPLARMVTKNKSHSYISYDGHILPISSKYTSHVPLITGPYAENFNRENMRVEESDIKIFNLLNAIDQDEFFSVQITQLEIDKKLNIKMYPQVTKQVIEFGKPEDIEDKFRKLEIFYHTILPQKGWNSYSRVNVNFKGQIVAE